MLVKYQNVCKFTRVNRALEAEAVSLVKLGTWCILLFLNDVATLHDAIHTMYYIIKPNKFESSGSSPNV